MSVFAVHGTFIFAKKTYTAPISTWSKYDSRITTVKFVIYTAVMRKYGKTLCSRSRATTTRTPKNNWFYEQNNCYARVSLTLFSTFLWLRHDEVLWRTWTCEDKLSFLYLNMDKVVIRWLSGGPGILHFIQKFSFERRQHFYITLQMNCSVNYHFKNFLTAIPFPLARCSVLSKRASSKSVFGWEECWDSIFIAICSLLSSFFPKYITPKDPSPIWPKQRYFFAMRLPPFIDGREELAM